MIILSLALSWLAAWLDIFFLPGFNMPITISFSFLGIVLWLLYGHKRLALYFAIASALLADLIWPEWFGVHIIWHLAIWALAGQLLTTLTIGQANKHLLLLFTLSLLHYIGFFMLIRGINFMASGTVGANWGINLLWLILSAVATSLIGLVLIFFIDRLGRVFGRYLLIKRY